MKIAALQPPYPYRPADMPALVEWLTTRLDECDASLDLIVLPEACDAMSSYPDYAAFEADVEAYCQPLLDKARATAIRCGALVAINLYKGPKGHYRNVTVLFDAAGNVAGEYFKQHLPQAEREGKRLDDAYTRAYHAPYTLDLDGVRYAFLTCYDNYYNEYIQHIALKKPDVLIVSSLQRGERMDILEMQMKNAAFTCNAWAVRASVSMGGEDCGHGANTMIVAPDGRVLASLGQKTGMLARDVDAKFKHMRADSYGQPPVPNDFFISKGRTPWAYRACGAGVIPGDRDMPYPRICAHRGFNYVAPENSLPAFGAAVALGAVEIELDVWPTKDGELIISHDESVKRLTGADRLISDMTLAEVRALDIGSGMHPRFAGLRFSTLQEVFDRFARRTIVNLHIKSPRGSTVYDPAVFQRIVDTIYAYDMQEHVYIGGAEDVLITARELAPNLPRAALDEKQDGTLVKLAKRYNCQKLQLFRGFYNQAMVDEAREAGIHRNLFWSNDPAEIPALLESGIETILTDNYLAMATAFEALRY